MAIGRLLRCRLGSVASGNPAVGVTRKPAQALSAFSSGKGRCQRVLWSRKHYGPEVLDALVMQICGIIHILSLSAGHQ